MSSNKNDNELIGLGLTPKALRQDLILFKEEVLTDIKSVQKEFTNKFSKMEETLKSQINIYESKVNNFEQRIMNLSNSISSDKALIKKVEELSKFKDDTNGKLLTESIRLTHLETDFKTNIKNIENILSNSVIYPGIIGYSAKFRTFHDFVDYVLKHISDLNLFKEKNIHDLGPYKKKINESIEFVKLQVNHIVGAANEFTVKSVNDAEQRMRSLIQLYDDRLQDTRVENANYSIGLSKKSEQLSRLIENIYEVRKDIYKKLNDEVKDMKVEQKQLGRYFTSYRKQFTLIKDKFAQLSEFIRDVRFRANLVPDAKKRDFVNMAKQMDLRNNLTSSYNSFNNKKPSDFSRTNTSDLDYIFESPEPYNNKNMLSKSLGISKRNSVQIGQNSFANKLSDKFNISGKKKNLYKNSISGTLKIKKSLTKNINIDDRNDILEIGFKQNTLNRRNTTAIINPNKLNKEFSQFNRKNSNFDFYNFIKEKDENSLSISSSEDYNDNEKEKNKIRLPSPSKKPIIKDKNQYIIKEEDENNNSEITEDNNNKKKKSKEFKINKEEDKRNSQIYISKSVQINKQNKIEKEKNIDEKILNLNSNNSEDKIESEENKDKDDTKRSKDNKINNAYKENSENKKNNEIEKNKKDDNEKEKGNEKNNQKIKEKLINKENDTKASDEKKGYENKNNIKLYINKNINNHNSDTNINNRVSNTNINKNITGAKPLNKKDNNIVKYQENKNEIFQKDKERNNTVSIVNINDIFKNNNFNDQRNQFLGTANNYFFAYTPEYEYKKQYMQTVKSITAKNSPSFQKFNNGKSSSKSFNKTKDNFINKQYEQYNDLDNIHHIDIDKSDQAYKTFTSFPKIQFEGTDKRRSYLNRKIVVLNNPKNKKINDVNNIINKRARKVSLNKKIDSYNYIKKGISPPL